MILGNCWRQLKIKPLSYFCRHKLAKRSKCKRKRDLMTSSIMAKSCCRLEVLVFTALCFTLFYYFACNLLASSKLWTFPFQSQLVIFQLKILPATTKIKSAIFALLLESIHLESGEVVVSHSTTTSVTRFRKSREWIRVTLTLDVRTKNSFYIYIIPC